ncbi:hypothetical protein MINT15_34290 [Saccharomonospora viridis]|uniref:Uncharacterized protein n=1 Tax=Saccharomonospora viridis TaxID=1852 RepID=A0A837D6F1_9PSEU|nr:hypothetical protein MINT15_34290 [Saccharomonospora viridis]
MGSDIGGSDIASTDGGLPGAIRGDRGHCASLEDHERFRCPRTSPIMGVGIGS